MPIYLQNTCGYLRATMAEVSDGDGQYCLHDLKHSLSGPLPESLPTPGLAHQNRRTSKAGCSVPHHFPSTESCAGHMEEFNTYMEAFQTASLSR